MDWGPLAGLETTLRGAVAGAGLRHVRLESFVRGPGGVWAAATYAHLGPPRTTAAPVAPAPRPSWWTRFLHAFLRLFGWRPPAVVTIPDAPAPAVDAVPALVASHGWLARRNLTFVIRQFAPFWQTSDVGPLRKSADNLPTEFARVSQRAIVRSLAVRALTLRPLKDWTSVEIAPCAPDDPPADLLSLHLDFEVVLAHLADEFPIPKRTPSTTSLGGGLRRRDSAARFAALVDLSGQSDSSGRAALARRLLGVLDGLLAASPLSRLVYLDIAQDSAPALAPERVRSLLSFGGPPRLWRDAWFSLLARSLVGAVLSPTRHVLQIERLEAERAAAPKERGDSSRRNQSQVEAELRPVRLAETTARARRVDDLLLLLTTQVPSPSRCYLQVRFLDLLVRHTATANIHAIAEKWNALRRQPLSTRRSRVLAAADGPLALAFVSSLVGPSLEEFAAVVSRRGEVAAKVLRARFEALLAPDVGKGTERAARVVAIGDDSGVPASVVAHVLARFADGEHGGVELPVRAAESSTLAPGPLLGEWLPATCARITRTALVAG